MAFPIDSNYFEQYAAIYGDADVAGILWMMYKTTLSSCVSSPMSSMVSSICWRRHFHTHLLLYGKGGWYYKCLVGFSRFVK